METQIPTAATERGASETEGGGIIEIEGRIEIEGGIIEIERTGIESTLEIERTGIEST